VFLPTAVGLEITFSREGRTKTRMIRVSTSAKNTVGTVSGASNNGSRPAGAVGDDDRGLGVVGSFPIAPVSTTLPTMLTVLTQTPP
jgi:hypothetical protein